MKRGGLKTILLMDKARSKGNRTAQRYSCWLCGKKCVGTADYLLHLQAHKDAIEMQKI
jgi:hypothetical protein